MMIAQLLLACGTPVDPPAATLSGSLSPEAADCLLRLANDCAYDVPFFDVTLKWDRRAADALVTTRNGADGRCGTPDDQPFADVLALDALPQVGPVALANLEAHLVRRGCIGLAAACDGPTRSIDGIAVTARTAGDIEDFLWRASPQTLQTIDGIGPVLAARLVTARWTAPPSLTTVAQLPGVGANVLGALAESVPDGWCSSPVSRCGCFPEPDDRRAWLLEQLADPELTSEFRQLLGDAGFDAMVTARMADWIDADPAGDPRSLLALALSDATFARPFATGYRPAHAAAAERATDALIAELGEVDLEDFPIGTALETLTTWARPAWLEEVGWWRTADPEHIEVIEMSHARIYEGNILGMPVSVSVSLRPGSSAWVEL